MRLLFLLSVLIVFAACGTDDHKASVEGNPSSPLSLGVNSDRFNQSFGRLLNDYESLKEAFISEKDSLLMNHISRLMIISADSLGLGELKADSSLIETARTYSLGISSELKGMIGETTMEGKRRSFQMVSDQMYDLIRTVQYKGAVIYQMYCPTAFSDQGANWLSLSKEIRNPYIPKKQLDCGSVHDSIDFRKK